MSSNPNLALQEAYTYHQIGVTRYSRRAVRNMLSHLQKVENETVDKLLKANTDWKSKQLEAFLVEVRALYKTLYLDLNKAFESQLTSFVETETEFNIEALDRAKQAARLNAAIQRPVIEQVYAATYARPFQGKLLKEWLSELEEGAAARVRDSIRLGFTEGQSITDIVKRIRGTKALQYKDGIMEISRRGAEAMVRTAINHTSQVARSQVFEANADIIQGEIWNALLDSRTTPICRSLDGTIFPIGKGKRPPAHINCRSYTSVIIKGFPPPNRRDYKDWFASQSAEVQDDILGKAKGKLYREGKLPLDRFTDNGGKELTLVQLKEEFSSNFKRAGL